MSKFTLNTTKTLLNGVKIPMLGFGVWDSPANLTTKSCLEAIKAGYRHIDTAQMYSNEAEVGAAIQQSGIPREDIFVTTKIFHAGKDAAATRTSLLESIRKCGGEGDKAYVDLLLIHNVTNGAEAVKLMWTEMEKLHQEGRIRAIGVSNFGFGHIDSMKAYATVWPPLINQLELHPWMTQSQIVTYCEQNDIALQAYCPIVRNQKAKDPVLTSIADKHGVTTTQVLLRWSLQKGWIPLPKSDNPERIRSNADLYGFELDEGDMGRLSAQSQEAPLCFAANNSATL